MRIITQHYQMWPQCSNFVQNRDAEFTIPAEAGTHCPAALAKATWTPAFRPGEEWM